MRHEYHIQTTNMNSNKKRKSNTGLSKAVDVEPLSSQSTKTNLTNGGTPPEQINENPTDKFVLLLQRDEFVRKLLIVMINNRIQEFADPLTNTLALMMISPIQLVFCEAGIIPFKTNALPIYSYSAMTKEELAIFKDIVVSSKIEKSQTTMESSGQYTFSVPLNLSKSSSSEHQFLSKDILLKNFVWILFHRNSIYHDKYICKALSNIVLQRLMARIMISSEVIKYIVNLIDGYFTSTDNTVPPIENKSSDTSTQCLLTSQEALNSAS